MLHSSVARLVLTSMLRGMFRECFNAIVKHKLAQLASLGEWQEMASHLGGCGKFHVCVGFAFVFLQGGV